MKIGNIITAFFAMIIGIALSACAGSGNINNPRTSIYTTGGGQSVGSIASSSTVNFDGNPCMKYAGVSQSEVIEKIAKNCKLVSTDQFVNNGKTYVMEEAARSDHPYNEPWPVPAGKMVYVDSNGIPAYWPECGNRIGEIQTQAVAPAPIPQGNGSGVYVDNHQENKTSWSLVLAPNLSISTSGGYGGYDSGCNYDRRPVCRIAQIRPDCYRQPVQQYCPQPVYSCPSPVQQYCPPPSIAAAYNGHGGGVYNSSGGRVR